jgi:DNA-binding PadR family transcriptional regulator
VLGLLNEAPRHGYDIQKWLEDTHADSWTNVRSGSIYHALQQLEKEGLVEVAETTQAGHRQKAVYAITAAGQGAFKHLLRQALQHLPQAFPAEFYLALVFLGELPRQEVRVLIEQLIPLHEQALASWDYGEAAKNAYQPLPEHVRAIFANGREHLEADLRLLNRLRDLLADEEGGIPAGAPLVDVQSPGHPQGVPLQRPASRT